MRIKNQRKRTCVTLVALGLCFFASVQGALAGLNDVFWSPSTVTNVVAWFDASDSSTITTNGSGEVTLWVEKSGDTNATDGSLYTGEGGTPTFPLYRASDAMAGGISTIGADTNSGQQGLYFTSDTYDTVFAVVYYRDGLASSFVKDPTIFSGPSGGAGQYRVYGSIGSDDFGTSVYFNDAGVYRNGSTNSLTTEVLPMPLTMFRFEAATLRNIATHLGYNRGYHATAVDSSWHGGYGEFIFASGISTEEKQKIEGYLAWKWDLEDELPAEHPWKSLAPGGGTPQINALDETTGITATSALLHGELTSTGGAPATVFCYWNPNSDPGETTAGWMYTNAFGVADGLGKYTNDTADTAALTSGTQYYYRYCATNSFGTNWSDAVSFWTYSAPEVSNSTGAVSETETSAILYGELSAGGGAAVWICWATNDAGTSATSDWDNVVSIGTIVQGVVFSNTVSALATNTTYFYRCYVTNAYGIDWSDDATAFSGTPVSSVVTGWTPAEIATVAWYDANDLTTITKDGSDKVSQWNDKSGNTNHAVQATLADQPTYQGSDAMVNNLPSIGNIASSGSIGLVTPSMSAKYVYVVAYYKDGLDSGFDVHSTLLSGTSGSGKYRVMGTSGSANLFNGGSFEFNDFVYTNGSSIHSPKVLPMPACILKLKSSGAIVQTYGLGFNQNDNSRDWQGSYCEFIFTDGTEDLETQQLIEGYLAWKWGLEESLADGHPHKDSDPGGGDSAVANLAPTNITTSAASLNASLDATGTNYAVYVYYGNTDGGTNASSWASTNSLGSYTEISTNLSYTASLAAGQTWYYTFMASNTAGVAWAEPSWTFSTPPIWEMEPTVFRFR